MPPTIDNYDVRSLGYVYLKHALVVIGIMWTCKMYEEHSKDFYSVKCSYHMCTSVHFSGCDFSPFTAIAATVVKKRCTFLHGLHKALEVAQREQSAQNMVTWQFVTFRSH